ncbi:MAG: 50S ribosomal protein L4 [Bacillota bacterium]|jgi:large subunit ribosomal protein L4
MPQVALYNQEGNEIGSIDLNEEVFGAEVNEALLHQVAVGQAAARRAGTASTKTRAEVRGGGRKPYRQKGTGWARHGSIRSPIWRKGGVAFGPKPRDFGFQVPRKARRVALKSALSAKVRDGEIRVVDRIAMQEPKTGVIRSLLKKLNVSKGALVVMAEKDPNVFLSARNMPKVRSIQAVDLNVYDVLSHGHLVITQDAVARVEEVLG